MSNPDVLQVLEVNGAIMHTLLSATGTWQGVINSVNTVNGNSTLQFSEVAGTGVDGTLHVCGVASDGILYHTYRNADGGWQGFYGNVNSENTGASVPAFTDVSCAGVQSNGLVHVCAVGTDGIIYHTFRYSDGWQGFYGNVNSENGSNTPSFSRVSCTTVNDTLYVFGLDNSGGRWGNVWYTYRNADGSWQGSFTSLNSFGPCLDVSCTTIDTTLHACAVSNYTGYIVHASSDNWQTTDTAPSYDPSTSGARFFTVSCANVDGNVHVAAQASSTDLHIVRDASGNWLTPYDDINQENNSTDASLPITLASTY